jgi:uncharacterized protein YydD (DUF2326 family)
MIRILNSDIPTFKTLQFNAGLNILLADKSEKATDRQTRNGSGKTSFIELIHFLLGADIKKESLLKSEALGSATFNAQIDIAGVTYDVARSVAKPSVLHINGDIASWPVTPKYDTKLGLYLVPNKQWKQVLGEKWFGLEFDEEESDKSFKPSFRSLISYFIRRQLGGGFFSHKKHSNIQQPYDEQVSLSYLLDLDWHISQDFEVFRKHTKIANELKAAARKGDLGPYFGKAADLRTKLTLTEAKYKRLKEQLDSFKVVPEYEKLEQEASALTRDISELNNQNYIDREALLNLNTAFESESVPDKKNLQLMYQEAGVILPDLVKKRFEEVEEFHATLIENRHAHLKSEIDAIAKRIEEREKEKIRLDARRAQVMAILQSGGALDHYTLLREELARSWAELKALQQRLEIAERFESSKTNLDIERANLVRSLKNDIHERGDIVSEAILAFEELSEALYVNERAGSLTIAETENGPDFEIKIDSQRSTGIKNMQIFCFDLMLTELSMRRKTGPGFLIHDSHLFDGVDERQIAKALQLGAEKAEKLGFQYIVTMNSDAIPKDGFRDGFDISKYFMSTRLTDATENGGLFGFRFN